jgi:hypothetical protein
MISGFLGFFWTLQRETFLERHSFVVGRFASKAKDFLAFAKINLLIVFQKH